jgi:hypothetical protein
MRFAVPLVWRLRQALASGPRHAERAVRKVSVDGRAEPSGAVLSPRATRSTRLGFGGWAVLVALFLFGEGLTRLVLTSPSRQVFDAELGFHYMPHAEFFNGSEGGARLTLNSLGFNDSDVEAKHSRRRVVVVGDSLTESVQVERADNYISGLKGLRPDLQLINLAQASIGPLEYRVLLDRFRPQLEPDVTIVAFSEGDLGDLQSGRWSVIRGGDGRIVAVRLEVADRHALKQAFEPLLQSSALATLLMRRIKPTLEQVGVLSREFANGPKHDIRSCGEVMSFILAGAKAEGPVVAMFLPQIDYLPARRSRMTRISSEESKFFQAAAAQAGVPFFIADEALMKQYEETGQPGHGFGNARMGVGHLNAYGHRAVAMGFASFLGQVLPADGH